MLIRYSWLNNGWVGPHILGGRLGGIIVPSHGGHVPGYVLGHVPGHFSTTACPARH